MANPNGRKGAQFETDVMKFLRSIPGVLAERLTKAGSKDEGDLVCVVAGKTYILELKNRKALSLPEFWAEAEVEALNYAKARGIGEVPLHYPAYSIQCECGIIIGGTSEKGLHSLLKRHKEKGIFHQEYKEK